MGETQRNEMADWTSAIARRMTECSDLVWPAHRACFWFARSLH
jgi:hypothetical protein